MLLGTGHLSDPWERTLSTRLADGDPEAIMELYDDIAPLAYGYALQLTRSKRRAYQALRSAFLHAIEQPVIFADHRLSTRARILLEVNHYALHEPHAQPHLSRRPVPVTTSRPACPELERRHSLP